MKITEILNPSCVCVPLKASEKHAAITELVDLLDHAGQLADRDQVLEAVLGRERTRSTGIGKGLAVPHGKSHGAKALTMALGKPATEMEFEAIDGRPCRFIVLLASPIDKTGPHIQALAGVSRLWLNEDFRRSVIEASTAAALYQAIEQHQG